MTNAIPDIVTIVGPSYFQPIADLVEAMLDKPRPKASPTGSGFREPGYAASLIVLSVAVLESFAARAKYCRADEAKGAPNNIPDLLLHLYPNLINHAQLIEAFLIRNVACHNHVWHLDNRDSPNSADTIKTPKELGAITNRHYDVVVNTNTRRTNILELNASPSSLDRHDVLKVMEVVWETLTLMNKKDFSVTPLVNDGIVFRRERKRYSDLMSYIQDAL
ncbi:MAG: hypothetical protein ACJAVI_005571 [Candidatus Azotimanducaceae bacterium]|jgi:hypothetical protein